jgi:outer membrane biosynthesis protein TonB
LVLIVHGQVEVASTNKRVHLTEKPERDPQHLGLHLTISDGKEPGHDTKCWALAAFEREVKKDEFNTVVIRWGFDEIARTPVVDDSEHHKALTAKTAALNAKHAKAPKKAPSKPAAPKPATPKPAAPTAAVPTPAVPKKAAAKKAAPKKAKKAAPKKAKKAKRKTAPKKGVAARAVKAVGGWAKGAKKALNRVIGTKKKKSARKVAKKAKGKKKR